MKVFFGENMSHNLYLYPGTQKEAPDCVNAAPHGMNSHKAFCNVKRNRNAYSMNRKQLFLTALACIALASCTDNIRESGPTEPKSEYNIFVMSDIHVMAPELLVEKGSAFENYVKTDPKLLEESGEVLRAVVDVVLEKKPDLVLIPGDLTKDGEMVSHQLVVSLLKPIRTAGIPVVVIPGNHDIDNPEGVYYQGGQTRPAERTSTQQFTQLYADYGYARPETVRDPASLSYTCEPLEGLVLICLDSNLYEENLFVERGASTNYNQTAGRIREATLEWMWQQADAARAAGKQVVAMMHHNAIAHYDGQATLQSPYVVRDYKPLAEGMMQHGIHLVFTGHQHLQDIAQYRTATEDKVDCLTDISTGATVSYPNVWRTITVGRDFTRWDVSTGYIKSIPSIADVQQECYKRSSTNIADGLLWHINEYWPTIESFSGVSSALLPPTPEETTALLMDCLGKPFVEAYMIHNAGNENDNPRSQAVIAEFEEGVRQLCRQLIKGRVKEAELDSMAGFLKTMLMQFIKPTLTSMLTDTNQAGDAALSSRTDDLQVLLTIPHP